MSSQKHSQHILLKHTPKTFLSSLIAACILYSAPSHAEPKIIYSDSFEAPKVSGLFAKDLSGWTNSQKSFPQNEVEIVSEPRRSGSGALRLYAIPSNSTVSKGDVEKELPSIRQGQTIVISAWFFIPPGPELNNLFLLDIECNQCWPERSPIPDKGPGVRIRLNGPTGRPAVERRKIGLRDMPNELGSSAPLPRGRWFKFEWRLLLSPDENGLTEITIDDKAVFRGRGPNLPDPEVFRRYGIELRQVLYNRLQVGITANSSSNPIELFVDDVSVAVD